MRVRSLPLSLVMILLGLIGQFLVPLAPVARAAPLADDFPGQPFNGLQVNYTVAGVELGQPTDGGSYTVERTYKGRLVGDKLVVSGAAQAKNGWSADLTVTAEAEGVKAQTYQTRKAPKDGMATDPMNQAFSVSLDVPKSATWAKFTISLQGSYNAGGRGVIVSGTFGRTGAVPPPTTAPATTTGPATDQTLIADVQGDVQIGADFAGPFASVGQKGLPAKVDDVIRTGPNGRFTIRYPDGATFKVKPNSIVKLLSGGIQVKQGDAYLNIKKSGREFAIWTPVCVTGGYDTMGPFAGPLPEDGMARAWPIAWSRSPARAPGEPSGAEMTVTVAADGTTIVQLLAGSGLVKVNATGAKTPLSPGQSLVVTPDGKTTSGSLDPTAERAKWAGVDSAGGPSIAPVWSDALDGKADSGAASFASQGTSGAGAARGVAWVAGSAGQAASLPTVDSYVGYAPGRLRADQGSIVFRYRPIPDLAGTFAKGHPSWTDSGQNKPPRTGYLIDTVGWGAAPKGSFMVLIDPASTGWLRFGVFDGAKWHDLFWKVPAGWTWDPNRWYEIGVTWGPKGMAILVDGEERERLADVVQLNATIPWFLGQAPWSQPYGPHTLPGTYDEVRIYAEPVAPYSLAKPAAGGASPQPTAAAGGSGSLAAGAAGKGTTGQGAAASAGGSAASTPRAAATPRAGEGGLSVESITGDLAAIAEDVATILPGGANGEVAGLVRRSPGGTTLLCLAPLVFGVLLLILLIVVLGRGRRPAPGPAPAAAAAGAYFDSAAPAPPADVTQFCEQCGAPLGANVRFCGRCGAARG